MMSEHPMLNVLLPLDGSIPGDTSLMAIHPLIRSGPVKCTLLHVAECEDPPKSLMTGFQRHREVWEFPRESGSCPGSPRRRSAGRRQAASLIWSPCRLTVDAAWTGS